MNQKLKIKGKCSEIEMIDGDDWSVVSNQVTDNKEEKFPLATSLYLRCKEPAGTAGVIHFRENRYNQKPIVYVCMPPMHRFGIYGLDNSITVTRIDIHNQKNEFLERITSLDWAHSTITHSPNRPYKGGKAPRRHIATPVAIAGDNDDDDNYSTESKSSTPAISDSDGDDNDDDTAAPTYFTPFSNGFGFVVPSAFQELERLAVSTDDMTSLPKPSSSSLPAPPVILPASAPKRPNIAMANPEVPPPLKRARASEPYVTGSQLVIDLKCACCNHITKHTIQTTSTTSISSL